MDGWMGIDEFLREVDRLARMQSAHLDHGAGPPGETHPGDTQPDGGEAVPELGEFTRHLLQVARGDAFEASDSPTVQTLEVDPSCFSTRWQFWSERPEAA
jgi:hypothetical protein